jgi:hypothetical protein
VPRWPIHLENKVAVRKEWLEVDIPP